jgi:hypothetical protein
MPIQQPAATIGQGQSMRHTLLVILLATPAYVHSAYGQSMLEHAAAAAGGSVGGVAGKKVSDGVTSILGKLDKQTRQAAGTGKTSSSPTTTGEPLFEVGPGVPKADQGFVPPPPPPARRASVAKPAPVRPAAPVTIAPPPVLAAPPAPPVTAEDLRALRVGTDRAEVLKLGPAASRITMFEDGHLVEVYRYSAHSSTVGVVKLTDGAVSSVQMP